MEHYETKKIKMTCFDQAHKDIRTFLMKMISKRLNQNATQMKKLNGLMNPFD